MLQVATSLPVILSREQITKVLSDSADAQAVLCLCCSHAAKIYFSRDMA